LVIGQVENQKFIFFHIWNTAGSSITSELSKYSTTNLGCSFPVKNFGTGEDSWGANINVHSTPDHLLKQSEIPKDTWTFTVVRNPWDWQISQYFHLKQGGQYIPQEVRDWFADFTEPGDMIRSRYKYWKRSGKGVDNQLDWAHNVDTVFKFEEINESWNQILKKLRLPPIILPHKNKHTEKKGYKDYYNDETIQMIAEIHASDIEAFNYKEF